MTETLKGMGSMPKDAKKTTKPGEVERAAVRELVKAALEEEMTEHLGHEKHQPTVDERGNVRDGARPKTVLTDAAGQVAIEVPRDRGAAKLCKPVLYVMDLGLGTSNASGLLVGGFWVHGS